MVGLVLALITAWVIYRAATSQLGVRTSDPNTPPTTNDPITAGPTVSVPGDLRVSVDCPHPGKGFVVTARATDGKILRVSAAIGGLPKQYVGEVGPYGRLRPIEGIGPSQSVGFDVQYVNEAGQGQGSYHFDVATPSDPC